jgi:hypothetical protein
MIKKLKLMLLSLSSVLILGAPLAVSGVAMAAPTVGDCLSQGSTLDLGSSNTCTADKTDQGTTLTDFIAKVLNVLSLIVGVVAVIMIIVGGFRYVTSAGNPEGTKGARSTILYAIVGLIVVALAQAVVRFVLQRTTQ